MDIVWGVIGALITLLLGAAGGIFLVGQMKANAEHNKKDIEAIKAMMKEYQESMKDLLLKSMTDMRTLLDTNKEHQKESLEREINHIKDLIAISSNETREDIKRLEARQAESNRVKERLAIAENSLRSLHHRLDIDAPVTLDVE